MARAEMISMAMVQELAKGSQEIPHNYLCKQEDGPSFFSIDCNIPVIDMNLLFSSPSSSSSSSWEEARNQEKQKLKAALKDWGFLLDHSLF
ncbi:hypothetical protein AMTR_s00033p00190980 [Amborella trichopoda]|uniref:Non-haem dioxygenase N-terminal domain-containing protein n=1 Tax=Amborella trichopoda TaxID=13333 RepID=U5D1R6_AMBTC|nr:hypothetical protein AMTR_s00033p00190980 [Amborella trichopoda]